MDPLTAIEMNRIDAAIRKAEADKLPAYLPANLARRLYDLARAGQEAIDTLAERERERDIVRL